ncbi:MAG: hypothetical protein ACR2NR_18200 [Solirubrobacteraceae bacterium]
MRTPSAAELIDRLAELPVGRTLLGALGEADGVYLVGGAVRDLLRGAAPADLDLVADRDIAALIGQLGVPARAHDRFGTATVSLGGTRFDLARARRERYPHPGALPEVQPAPLGEDLQRRDFTVNALALALGGARRGQLLAVSGGLEDLDGGLLRVLHDDSFHDDPTRLLRLARYMARLGFTPDPHTAALAGEAIAAGALATVSGARLGAELRLTAGEPDPVAALWQLRTLTLDSALIPGFGLRDPALASRALALLPPDGNRAALVLATAARDVAPSVLERRLGELAFEAGQRDVILVAARRAPILAQELDRAREPSAIAAAAAGAPVELVALTGALGPEEAARRWLQQLRDVGLEIGGDDLVAAGIRPGPSVGAGLRAALAAKLDGRVQGRDAELSEALRVAGEGG